MMEYNILFCDLILSGKSNNFRNNIGIKKQEMKIRIYNYEFFRLLVLNFHPLFSV